MVRDLGEKIEPNERGERDEPFLVQNVWQGGVDGEETQREQRAGSGKEHTGGQNGKDRSHGFNVARSAANN